MADFTQILVAFERGGPQAADNLPPLVYAELRKRAAQNLTHEKAKKGKEIGTFWTPYFSEAVGTGCRHWARPGKELFPPNGFKVTKA